MRLKRRGDNNGAGLRPNLCVELQPQIIVRSSSPVIVRSSSALGDLRESVDAIGTELPLQTAFTPQRMQMRECFT